MRTALTKRDEDLLKTLTHRVHVATAEQIGRGWWGGCREPGRSALERVRTLQKMGLVECHRVNIHPLLRMEKPEACWSPGQPRPDFGAVAYRLRNRWTRSLKLTAVVIASKKAANTFAGFGGKFKHRTQLTHDTHVAELYLRRTAMDATVRERWVGEEILGRDTRGEKVPDALLTNGVGEADLVIDFGGSYDKRRVQQFHSYCEKNEVAYELW
ncbi:hypothetical protein Mal65_52680 [Crateriforma conspicua]|nr:hypothetical protein Mal65_52680 [Crateriforma conspicua]